jgi:hypothetical protein
MYGVDIPCPHRFYLGAARSILRDVTLDFVRGNENGDPSEQLRIFCQVKQQAPAQTHGSCRDYFQKMVEPTFVISLTRTGRKRRFMIDSRPSIPLNPGCSCLESRSPRSGLFMQGLLFLATRWQAFRIDHRFRADRLEKVLFCSNDRSNRRSEVFCSNDCPLSSLMFTERLSFEIKSEIHQIIYRKI